MKKIKIDTTIINKYLSFDLQSYENDTIYLINKDQNIYTTPTLNNYDRISHLYQSLIHKLENIDLFEQERYQIFLNDASYLEKKLVIKILVGFPKEIRKIFLEDEKGMKNIIFDLHNYVEVLNDNDDIITDILDYLYYAICLLIIDAKESRGIKSSLDRLEHALYATSFAYYISSSKQLGMLECQGNLDMWLFLEYDTLTRRRKKDINNYLDMVLTYNPEMIILGVSGKYTLENMSEVEALKCFSDGRQDFIKTILVNKELKDSHWMMKTLSILKTLIIPLIIIWIVTIIPIIFTKELNVFFKIMPLIVIALFSLITLLEYKLNHLHFFKMILKLGLYLLISLIFLLLFR